MKIRTMKINGDCQSVRENLRGYFLKTVLILCLGVFMGFFALCLVHLLPVEKMYDNAQVAKDMITEVGATYLIHEIKSTGLDNYTDSIMVNTAICPIEAPIFEKAVYNYHVSYLEGYMEQENLRRYLTGEGGYDYAFYSHYWNGYLIFLKPLLFLFEYNDILVFNFIAQMLLIVWVIIGMVKQKKEFLIMPLMVTVLSIGAPIATSLSIQISDVLYIALVGAGIIIWNNKKIDNQNGYMLFLVLGMLTSYLDFLTYPLVSLGIPLVVYISCNDVFKPLENVFRIIINSIGWAVGYVGMWLSKGILGSLLFPDSQALERGIRHFFGRSSNMIFEKSVNFFDVLTENMFAYLNWPIVVVIVFGVISIIIKIIKKRNSEKKNYLGMIPYLVIIAYPFAWLMVMKNHSYIHAYMVYRVLSIAVFAGLSMLSFLAQKNDVKNNFI